MAGFDFGDLLDEAFERAGLDASAISHRHLNSARRSLLLLNTIIENKGGKPEYREETVDLAIPTGHGAVPLPAGTIDVLACAVLYPDGSVNPLGRTTREDYANLSRPSVAGTPSMFWVSKSMPNEQGLLTPPADVGDLKVLVLWPQNGAGGIQLRVTRLREIGMPTGMGDQIDARRNWWETYCQGLAAALAGKFNQAAAGVLEARFQQTLMERFQDENRGPIQVGFRGHGWSRPRRH